MHDPVDALIVDLLEWIGPQPRPYAEVLEAWRTSCPRLPVWEEANARGYVDRVSVPGDGARVVLSARGKAHLRVALAARATDAAQPRPQQPAEIGAETGTATRAGRASTPEQGSVQRQRAERSASNA